MPPPVLRGPGPTAPQTTTAGVGGIRVRSPFGALCMKVRLRGSVNRLPTAMPAEQHHCTIPRVHLSFCGAFRRLIAWGRCRRFVQPTSVGGSPAKFGR